MPSGYPLSTPGINAEKVLGLADLQSQVEATESPQYEPWQSSNHTDALTTGLPRFSTPYPPSDSEGPLDSSVLVAQTETFIRAMPS